MNDFDKYIFMLIGLIFACTGIIIFAKQNNQAKIISSLVIFLLGVGLIVFPYLNPASTNISQKSANNSPKKDNILNSTWESLDTLFSNQNIDCQQELTWLPDMGLRGFYCHVKTSLSYKQLQDALDFEIFVRGPHSRSALNLDARYEFGHYNPKFVKWLANNAIYGIDNQYLKTQFQPVFNQHIREQARTYYLAYKYLLNNNYFMNAIIQEYSLHLTQKTLPSMYLQEIFRPFSDNLEQIGYNSYEANTAAGFWIRRSIDGTAKEFFTVLQTLLITYDPEFVFTERGFGY